MWKFHADDVHYPDLGSASDWLKENSLAAQPIRNATKIWVVHIISMEFLRSLLRRRFARAQWRPRESQAILSDHSGIQKSGRN